MTTPPTPITSLCQLVRYECTSPDSVPVRTAVSNIANLRALRFKTAYSPTKILTSVRRSERSLELGVLDDNIKKQVEHLKSIAVFQDYSVIDDISWDNIAKCIKPLTAGGSLKVYNYKKNEYIGDGGLPVGTLPGLVYLPSPLFSLDFVEKLNLAHGYLRPPIFLDKFFSPNLALVVMFAFLVLLYFALVAALRPSPHQGAGFRVKPAGTPQ